MCGWVCIVVLGVVVIVVVCDMEYGFEEGNVDVWWLVFVGLVGLGFFGVVVLEDCGGVGGSIEDLCVMVDEVVRVLVLGLVVIIVVVILVVFDFKLCSVLVLGEWFVGVVIDGGV